MAIQKKEKFIQRVCKKHGETTYVLEGSGYYRCRKCRSEAVTRRRKKVKSDIIKEFGGRCSICGYDKCEAALVFHHISPSEKSFSVSNNGATRSFGKVMEEARKCMLVCRNCHAELHYC